MSIPPIKYLTIDEVIVLLNAFLRNTRNVHSPVLLQNYEGKDFSLCQFELVSASQNNIFRGVSRGGQPVVILAATSKPATVLTIGMALAQLHAFKGQTGSGEIPVLAESALKGFYRLCDVQEAKSGVKSVLKRVRKGGVGVVMVAFGVPIKVTYGY
ncbi:MAG: hypothetical protein Q7U16_12760 [Agitococcus sp.]|nr:hypothetical protein [Agitococcus sp.]